MTGGSTRMKGCSEAVFAFDEPLELLFDGAFLSGMAMAGCILSASESKKRTVQITTRSGCG
jgi:hypothetical protein